MTDRPLGDRRRLAGQLIRGIDVPTARALYPRLQDYFGVWAMQPEPLLAAANNLKALDLAAHIRSYRDDGDGATAGPADYELRGGVAIIDVQGTLMKAVSSFEASTSTVLLRQQIRHAFRNTDAAGILLRFDSPGGTVAGTEDLAADIAAAAGGKPVYGYAEDLCASAAYWGYSQCTKTFANATALVGSIGTYMAIEDLSGHAEQLGVKVHVIRAGTFKGAGTPGTEITDDQLAEWQRIVDELNAHFIAGVARGRRMGESKVRELADGRVHVGQAAVQLGLVDVIESFDDTLARLSRDAKGKGATRLGAPGSSTSSRRLSIVQAIVKGQSNSVKNIHRK